MTSKIFATVGSTQFDALVNAVLDPRFLDFLSSQGRNVSLTLQYGQSVICHPELLKPASLKRLGIQVQTYAYKDDILSDMSDADLIICHAGAGTLLEGLRLGKPVIAVINDALMDDHQKELALQLEQEGYIAVSTPTDLLHSLQHQLTTTTTFKKYPQANLDPFYSLLDSVTRST